MTARSASTLLAAAALLAAVSALGAGADDAKPPGLLAAFPPLKDESHLFSVTYSTDGKVFVTVLDNHVHFRDAATWKETASQAMRDRDRPLALAPDGSRFCWLDGGHEKSPIALYDVGNEDAAGGLELRPHVGPVAEIALVDGGKTLVGAGGLDGHPNIWRWDVASGEQKVTSLAGDNDAFYAFAVSADGKLAAGGFQRGALAVSVLEVETGKELRRVKTGDHYPKSVALSPDGKLVAASAQQEPVRVYDVATGKLHARLPHIYAACVRFSPDGKLLLTSDKGQFCLWSVEEKKLLAVYGRDGPRKEIEETQANANGPERGACFSPDGTQVAWGCEVYEWGTVRVFEVAGVLKACGGK